MSGGSGPAWVFLLIGGLFEIGWAISLRASEGFTKWVPIIFYGLCGIGAAFFLSQAMKQLPMSVSYTVWVGIAVMGTTIVDMVLYGEQSSPLKIISVVLIAAGVAGLKVAAGK